MRYISKLFILVAMTAVAQTATAQPPVRRAEAERNSNTATVANIELSERARTQYPGTVTPQEVDWKRDVYRELDLSKESNASLYYPVEPIGNSMNLFTFLFQNIINGNITAYKYNLDGNELFTDDNVVDVKNMLANYRIYYEENDGAIVVGKSDVPSAEVLSYYIKESHYYDQRTGTYSKRVTAICPVLHRSGEFTSEVTKYPMFWLNYDNIAPQLTQQTVMTSSLNNVASMTIDDYFKKGCYDGDIYKTVNMRNLAIAQYCSDSTEIRREQEMIESQLEDFHTNLWNTRTVAQMRQDSINAANDTISTGEDDEREERRSTRRSRRSSRVERRENNSSESSSGNSNRAARVSVRRTRR